ncbi:hypothetical protein BA059_24145 [Mycolicibacterium sp. (ex Dasyatis americana)]|uniref:Transmembrane protein n=1 Tax=Mycobacterium syngnathidarum TaxID=1908205 RepID=A0A1Q9WE42_9MYCO|nr:MULTISPECIES: hypothetical protein [Mycobacterium]OFB36414.1 hypothetical protein BA059_24145 [Mycolicibacterium sp. (ex Dasyatis americana)]MCG7605909.1 hypothetical protein [Mycobacterium sp. CnD-18-1]OHU07854.1 hypothetical protein BKG61_00340 [Mycobacterium syngnathidarum]OLT97045.1 hypothetical protein BKG60_09385 [Mycobacterium syngnathidarum]TMS54506.1 hypothetical protein E0T84_06780 [Mycobacterium sp. DBP42]
MLIIALVLAVIGLAALVTAVVTSNELIAWVCIGASVIGVLLLIVDALRERSRGTKSGDDEDALAGSGSAPEADATATTDTFDAVDAPVDYPDEVVAEPESDVAVEPDAADADVEADDSAEQHKN